MSLSKEIKIKLLPWLLIFFGLLFLNYFKGLPGGVSMILGITIIVDRLLPENKV